LYNKPPEKIPKKTTGQQISFFSIFDHLKLCKESIGIPSICKIQFDKTPKNVHFVKSLTDRLFVKNLMLKNSKKYLGVHQTSVGNKNSLPTLDLFKIIFVQTIHSRSIHISADLTDTDS
jgi:hypothetical protein